MSLVVFVAIIAVIIFIALVIAGWIAGMFNTFVVARQDMETQWSNVKTEYQRRADLIMNLVASVKGYIKHERETLKEVIAARSGNFGATRGEEIGKMKGIDKFLSRLMLLQEQYPMLKADTQFTQLNEEVVETENRVNIARTDYNNTVRDYNILIKMWPRYYFANRWKYVEGIFFVSEQGVEKAPVVKFVDDQKVEQPGKKTATRRKSRK